MIARAARLRSLALIIAIALLLAVFVFVLARSGPLAPILVTVAEVKSRPLTPALFGIGTVEARYTHHIGPTTAGRVARVLVEVGDEVKSGQLIAEIDPIDLDQRIASLDAARKRSEALIVSAWAQIREASARAAFAASQAQRYAQLFAAHSISAEAADGKRQEQIVAESALSAARAAHDAAKQDLGRLDHDQAGLVGQRNNLRLLAPVDGLVLTRKAEAGDTVVAGQSIVQIIDPGSLWLDIRFDQSRSAGLQAGLPAAINLRSSATTARAGTILRVEPVADAVTEETLAKVIFAPLPQPAPPLGELAEVTVALPELPAAPVIPNAALKRINGKNGQNGVWIINKKTKKPTMKPVRTGVADLDGFVQIIEGLAEGDQIIVYSKSEISEGSRIKIVEQLVKGNQGAQ